MCVRAAIHWFRGVAVAVTMQPLANRCEKRTIERGHFKYKKREQKTRHDNKSRRGGGQAEKNKKMKQKQKKPNVMIDPPKDIPHKPTHLPNPRSNLTAGLLSHMQLREVHAHHPHHAHTRHTGLHTAVPYAACAHVDGHVDARDHVRT